MTVPSAPQGRAPILECVREGFGFLRRDWRPIATVSAVGAALLTPAEVWSDAAQAAGDGGSRVLAAVLGVLLQLPILAAFYRRALSRGAEPLTLRVGRDELNLAGVSGAMAFLFVVVFLAGFLVISMALAALTAGSNLDNLRGLPVQEAAQRFSDQLGTEGQLVLLVLMLLLAGLALWLSARLALAYPSTVADQRMRVFETFGWTKGNAGPVAACLLLTVALGIALGTLALLIPASLVSAVFGREAVQSAGHPAHWLVTYMGAYASLVFFLAPYAGVTAYLYRGLRPS